MCLVDRCDHVRCAMQIYTILPERLPVIGHIEDQRVIVVFQSLEFVDQLS